MTAFAKWAVVITVAFPNAANIRYFYILNQ